MNQQIQFTKTKSYAPFHGPFDPCPPIGLKYYSTPPQLYLGVQPRNLAQFYFRDAIKKGTLWPALYDSYENPYKSKG